MNIKKLWTIFPMAAMMMACQNNTDQKAISDAAQHYLDATANYRLDDARPYGTAETQHSLNTMQRIMDMTDSAYITNNQPAEVTIISVEMKNDTTAIVKYHKHTPIKDKDSQLKMRKRDGKWFAHVVMNQ